MYLLRCPRGDIDDQCRDSHPCVELLISRVRGVLTSHLIPLYPEIPP